MSGDIAIGLATPCSTDSCAYGIPPHVHVCVTAEGSVLLDLEHDKYFGLGREETEILATAVNAWPRPSWGSIGEHDAQWAKSRADELCSSMVERGLLNRAPGGVSASLTVGCPRDMKNDWISIGDEIEVNSVVTPRHCADFASAHLWARCSLAWRPFLATVQEVRTRKSRGISGEPTWHLLQVAGVVDVFRRLRPFFFAAEGHCLLHALTLVRFLSKSKFYPDWVIGVTTQPWGAHSWVQWGDYLLDTNPEKVCAYTPILVV